MRIAFWDVCVVRLAPQRFAYGELLLWTVCVIYTDRYGISGEQCLSPLFTPPSRRHRRRWANPLEPLGVPHASLPSEGTTPWHPSRFADAYAASMAAAEEIGRGACAALLR